ncbi:MAG: sugar phosphate isomerase/epimerase family protein [Nitrososphaeraceae archaeon]
MKLAFSTNAYKKYSLNNAIERISKIGYKGVEILCDIPHAYPPSLADNDIEKIKGDIAENNLEISNLNAFTLYAIGDVYHPSWIEYDNKLSQIRIEHTVNCIKLAHRLGAKNLSTEPGGPIEVKNLKYTQDKNMLLKRFVKNLQKIYYFAEKNDVKILVEPEPSLLLETSDEFLQFIKEIRSEYIKLNFDIGHFYCVREEPEDIIYKLIDHIEHFHIADISKERIHHHLIPGHGSIKFEKVFDVLKKIGYEGFITVELYPYQDNPDYAAKSAYNYLINLIN